MVTKTHNRNIPEDRENQNDRFRVKYGDRSRFYKLQVNIIRLKTGESLTYIFNSDDLGMNDSIHFTTTVANGKFMVEWTGNMNEKAMLL